MNRGIIISDTVYYSLDVRVPDQTPRRINIEDKVVIGSASDVDFYLPDLLPRHCIFRLNNGVLSLYNLSDAGDTYLEGQKLLQGKMYILDNGDKITLAKAVEIIVRCSDEVVEAETTSVSKIISRQELVKELGHAPEPEDKTENIEAAKENDESETADRTEPNFEVPDLPPREKTDTKPRTAMEMFKRQEQTDDSLRTKREKEIKKQMRGGDSATLTRPGLLLRLYSTVTSFLIAYGVLFFIIPFFELSADFANLKAHLAPLIQTLLTFIPEQQLPVINSMIELLQLFSLPDIYLCYIAQDLFFNLLLGKPLTYCLLGVGCSDSILGKRLKGMIRALINSITLPLIIFDLPVLFKKRSFKETLTSSTLHYRHKILRFFAVLIAFPALITLGILSPLLENFDENLNALKATFPTPTNHAVERSENKENLSLKSNYFAMEMPMGQEIAILPLVKAKKRNLIVYDYELNTHLLFSVGHQQFDLPKIIKQAAWGNPFFHFKFPALVSDTGGTPQELEPFFRMLFDINIKNISSYIAKYGPFIAGIIKAKNMLLNDLALFTVDKINLSRSNSELFLEFYKTINQQTQQVFFAPALTKTPAPVYTIEYQENSADMASEFYFRLLSTAKWYWRKKPEFTPQQSDYKNGFAIIDLIYAIDKGERIQDLNQIYLFYLHISKVIFKKVNGPEELELLNRSIKSTILHFEKITQQANNPDINKLLSNLKKIEEALIKNNSRFFK